MALQVQLVRDSFTALAPKHGAMLQTFYDTLFQRYPQVRPLFAKTNMAEQTFYDTLFQRYPQVRPLFAKTNMAEQQKKLGQALALVVANLERPDVLTTALHEMGARHVGYGTEPPHYDAVGECLLHALAVTAGPLRNDELAQAWRRMAP